jgi:vancomycin resistance protein YoaR
VTDLGSPLKRDRRIVRWLLLGLLVLFGGAYVAGYFFTGDRIATGTTIAGVHLGGKTPAAAARALDNLASASEPITLTADGKSVHVSPADAGLSVDVDASVDQVAVGRSWNPRHMWEFVAGGSSYDGVDAVDDAKLDKAIADFAKVVDEPPQEGAVRFTRRGRPAPSYPTPGRAIDQAAARDAVLAAYPEHTGGALDLPYVTAQPTLSEAEVSRAMKEFANPAVSAPVVFRIAGERVTLQPADFAPALSMKAVDGRLEPQLDDKLLLAAVAPAMKMIALAPKDASVRIVDGVPQVIPGKSGVTFDPDAITGSFLKLVVAEGKGRELGVKTQLATPDHTAAEVRALGIKEQVSAFTTYFPYAEYRNINIGRAAELINGTILKPGETFSLNGVVGERTAENGFTKGFIISDGVFRQDLGGGVSQVATTTFNAAFFAGLKDVEHKPHSFYISRYPVGREATVAWPTVDLKVTNDTPYGILVQAWRDLASPSTQGAMNVRMWSTKTWDIKAGESSRYNFTSHKVRHLPPQNCEPNSGYGGFDIDVYRFFYKHGSKKLDHKETMHTHYIPSDTVICDG